MLLSMKRDIAGQGPIFHDSTATSLGTSAEPRTPCSMRVRTFVSLREALFGVGRLDRRLAVHGRFGVCRQFSALAVLANTSPARTDKAVHRE